MVKYGILDELGHVIRWVWDKPSDAYKYITVKIKRTRLAKPGIDWSKIEPAPF